MEVSAVPREAPAKAGTLSPNLLRFASDDRLASLARGGSAAAFEAIYRRHHRAILSFCRHMVGSPEEAEDAVQHTFLAAYRDLIGTQKEIRLRPWLFAIARNRCYSALRSRRETPVEHLAEPATEWLSTEVQRRQDLRDLLADLARLPHEQREALVLAELGALTHEQIAAVLDVRCERVKALVFQAREALVGLRAARETDCGEIREQLATMRGGGLRRGNLRRHLRQCEGCREFRRQLERQRRRLEAILPVVPTLALRQGLFAGGARNGLTLGRGGLNVGGPAVPGAGFGAKALVTAIVAGVGAAGSIFAVSGLPSGDQHRSELGRMRVGQRASPPGSRQFAGIGESRGQTTIVGGSGAPGITSVPAVRFFSPTATGDGTLSERAADASTAVSGAQSSSAAAASAVSEGALRSARRVLAGSSRASAGAAVGAGGTRISASADPARGAANVSLSSPPASAQVVASRGVPHAATR